MREDESPGSSNARRGTSDGALFISSRFRYNNNMANNPVKAKSNKKLVYLNYFSLWGLFLFWASFFFGELGSQYFSYTSFKGCYNNCSDSKFACPDEYCAPVLVVPVWVHIAANLIFLLSLICAFVGLVSAIRSVAVAKNNKGINKRSFIYSIYSAFLAAFIHIVAMVSMLLLFWV